MRIGLRPVYHGGGRLQAHSRDLDINKSPSSSSTNSQPQMRQRSKTFSQSRPQTLPRGSQNARAPLGVDKPKFTPKRTPTLPKTQSQEKDIKEPIPSQAPRLDRGDYWSKYMEKDSASYVALLPDLLGVRFDPNLYVEAGFMPPLQGSDVSPAYELEYLQNVKASLDSFLSMLSTKSDWLQVHGATTPDGAVNPHFMATFLYGVLGVAEDSDGWPLKKSSDAAKIPTEIAFSPFYIEQKLQTVKNAIMSVETTIQSLAAQSQYTESPVEEVISSGVKDVTVEEKPAVAWYEKTTNQALIAAGLLGVGFAAYKLLK